MSGLRTRIISDFWYLMSIALSPPSSSSSLSACFVFSFDFLPALKISSTVSASSFSFFFGLGELLRRCDCAWVAIASVSYGLPVLGEYPNAPPRPFPPPRPRPLPRPLQRPLPPFRPKGCLTHPAPRLGTPVCENLQLSPLLHSPFR